MNPLDKKIRKSIVLSKELVTALEKIAKKEGRSFNDVTARTIKLGLSKS